MEMASSVFLPKSTPMKRRSNFVYLFGSLAQLVERWTEDPVAPVRTWEEPQIYSPVAQRQSI
jgi:hypothetical protein